MAQLKRVKRKFVNNILPDNPLHTVSAKIKIKKMHVNDA